MKREQIEKDLRNLKKVISYFQDDLDEIKHQYEKMQDKEEHTYSIGDRFKHGLTRDEYIIARTDLSTVLLVNLRNGNRWSNPVGVKDINYITKEEFNEITNNESEYFKPIKKQQQ